MVSIKHGLKLSQMLSRGWVSSDMQCERGTGNAECISGLFMGALGAAEGNARAVAAAANELLPGFMLWWTYPWKTRTSVSVFCRGGKTPPSL